MNIFRGFCNFIWQNKRYILVFLFSMLVLVFLDFQEIHLILYEIMDLVLR